MMLAQAPALCALAVLLAAAAIDVSRFEIPDTVSVLLALLAAAYGLLHPGFGWPSHLAAPVLMFAFGLLAFSRGWLGGGDVKMMTALALWTGLTGLPLLFLAVAMAGGVLALLLILLRRGLSMARLAPAAGVLHAGAPMPYAVAIAAGALWWAWAVRLPL